MFKEKLYNGELTSYTATASITRYPSTSTINANIYKTDLLNNCIVDFLKNECGLTSDEVKYYPIENSTNALKGNLFIHGFPLQYVITGNSDYYNIYDGSSVIFEGNTYNSSNKSYAYTSYSVIFSAAKYNFKICLIGNPKAHFALYISLYSGTYPSNGFYANSTYIQTPLLFTRLRDFVNGDYFTYCRPFGYNSSGSGAKVCDKDGNTANVYMGDYGTTFIDISTDQMNVFPNKYPLIPKIFGGFYEVVNGYELVSAAALNKGSTFVAHPTATAFWKIGNDNYCLLFGSEGMIVKL